MTNLRHVMALAALTTGLLAQETTADPLLVAQWQQVLERGLEDGRAHDTLARLVALIGEAGVIDLIYTSRLIEADEALRKGLVNEVVEDHDAVVARADALARQLAGHAPLTMRVTKELLRRLRQRHPTVEDDDLIGMVYTSADFKEGMAAFLEKRKPNWQGR